MQIGLSPTSPTGVVMAAYSSRHTRMWAWDVDSQEIIGFQDIKGRGELLDVSEDGRYCSWFIDVKGGLDSHVGVSRPPFFHALFWRRAIAVISHQVRFGEGTISYETESYPDSCFDGELERVEAGCPFELVEIKLRREPRLDPSPFVKGTGESLTDRQGRTIQITPQAVLSNSKLLIDLTRPEFTAVPHPEWAKEW